MYDSNQTNRRREPLGDHRLQVRGAGAACMVLRAGPGHLQFGHRQVAALQMLDVPLTRSAIRASSASTRTRTGPPVRVPVRVQGSA
ncbi:hypothetical protein ACWC1D_26405 [Streptomyces sp. NPDC001478]